MTDLIESLKTIQKQQFEIQTLEERIEQIKSKLQYTSPQITDMPIGTNSCADKIGNQVGELLAIRDQLSVRQLEIENNIDKITAEIRKLPELQYKILYYKYIKGSTWKEIGELTNYHVVHCQRIEKAALNNLKNML